MKFDELKTNATKLTADLRSLSNHKLYVCANAYAAEANYPDRIIVEGIKNLHTTGRFTAADRSLINTKLLDFCVKHELKIKILDADSGMHNAIITCN